MAHVFASEPPDQLNQPDQDCCHTNLQAEVISGRRCCTVRRTGARHCPYANVAAPNSGQAQGTVPTRTLLRPRLSLAMQIGITILDGGEENNRQIVPLQLPES